MFGSFYDHCSILIFMFVIFAGARYQRISYPNKVQTSVQEVLRTFPTAGTTVVTRHKLEGKNLVRLSVLTGEE